MDQGGLGLTRSAALAASPRHISESYSHVCAWNPGYTTDSLGVLISIALLGYYDLYFVGCLSVYYEYGLLSLVDN